MKIIQFEDTRRQQIQVSLACDGDTRIYVNADQEGCPCIKLNEYQANILINALKDFIEGVD